MKSTPAYYPTTAASTNAAQPREVAIPAKEEQPLSAGTIYADRIEPEDVPGGALKDLDDLGHHGGWE